MSRCLWRLLRNAYVGFCFYDWLVGYFVGLVTWCRLLRIHGLVWDILVGFVGAVGFVGFVGFGWSWTFPCC